MTATLSASAEVLPSLSLLPHRVRVLPLDASALVDPGPLDAILIDGRSELAAARGVCRVLPSVTASPVILVCTEGGLAALSADWPVADVLLHTAGPAEVEARLRLAITRTHQRNDDEPAATEGALVIDEHAYAARLAGTPLDLTYKEFELLKHLASHPGRVFTRAQLLDEVWGYGYFGGTRTVDVHVRRLRAKLGPEHDALIATVRNVGYRYSPPSPTP